ncbi:aquaporin-like protein, partial [Blyttiomyces helicus]
SRKELAEFFGTFVLITFGAGVCAQTTFSHNKNGEYLSINIGWALGTLFGIYVAGGISGAHLNCAVTITNAVHGRFPWKRVPGYCLAQILGAFTAAACIYANYHSAFDNYDGGIRMTPFSGAPANYTATAGIFSTYPASYMTTVGSFFSEFYGTAILMIGLFAIGEKSSVAPNGHGPMAVACLILAIGACLG